MEMQAEEPDDDEPKDSDPLPSQSIDDEDGQSINEDQLSQAASQPPSPTQEDRAAPRTLPAILELMDDTGPKSQENSSDSDDSDDDQQLPQTPPRPLMEVSDGPRGAPPVPTGPPRRDAGPSSSSSSSVPIPSEIKSAPVLSPTPEWHIPREGLRFNMASAGVGPGDVDVVLLEEMCQPVADFKELLKTPDRKGIFRAHIGLQGHDTVYTTYAYVFSRIGGKVFTWFPGLVATPDDLVTVTLMYGSLMTKPANAMWKPQYLASIKELQTVPNKDDTYRSLGYVTDEVNGLVQKRALQIHIIDPLPK